MSILIFFIFFFWGGGGGGRTLRNEKRHIEKKGDNFILAENRITKYEFKKVSSMDFFLKTNGLTHFFKEIWYAKSENQCLQAEKWRLIELICMISRWPPKSYRILHCC